MNYTVIRSRRKSLAIEIRNMQVIVRAPMWVTGREIEHFLTQKADWIEAKLREQAAQQQEAENAAPLSEAEHKKLIKQAKEYIPERVAYYAPKVGVRYGQISIRTQKTRWGSCSSKGNLNFNCLLMLTPPEVIDSVVVHELCHLKEMNHSARFYNEVRRVYPGYDRWNRWLKEHGAAIMARVKDGKSI